jgi:hypothetical protein
MNFYFTKKQTNVTFKDLIVHKVLDNYFLFLDQGWKKEKNYFYKGIHDAFCKIYVAPFIKIETNKLRDFPIYYNSTSFSNFEVLENILPIDGILEFDKEPQISFQKNFYPALTKNELDFDTCHNILFNALIENVKGFISKNTKPLFVPAQKGIDTLTVRSVLDYLKVKYELFHLPDTPPKRSKTGEFLSQKYWGFSQIEERDNSVIVTGFYGDEWILRNPYHVSILLSQRKIDLAQEFDKVKDGYMKKFFETYRKKCVKETSLSLQDLMALICNDFQIWHLHNTYFFSPLKHENILKLLSADKNTIIGQITDAKLSKSIIKRCNPALLDSIDSHKNQHDPYYFL